MNTIKNFLTSKSKTFSSLFRLNDIYSKNQVYLDVSAITYYGYVSLFPLILIGLTVIRQIFLQNNYVHKSFISAIEHNFPIVGKDLGSNVHALSGYGLSLAASILIALYGSLGLGSSLIDVTRKLTLVKKRHASFIKTNFWNLLIVLTLGIVLITSGFTASYISISNKFILLKLIFLILDLGVIYFGVIFINYLISPSQFSFLKLKKGLLISSIGILSVQLLGGYVITHQLARASILYGAFSLSLILLFWIYLIARIYVYGLIISSLSVNNRDV